MNRRRMLTGAMAAALARSGVVQAQAPALGFTPDPAFLRQARTLLARNGGAIDLHAHPGRTFSREGTLQPGEAFHDGPAGAFEDQSIADMRSGLVSAASFAAVADAAVLQQTATGILVTRPFAPGEAQANYRRQIANLHAVTKALGVRVLRAPGDLARLEPGRDVGAILTVEGGDFLEGDGSSTGEERPSAADGVANDGLDARLQSAFEHDIRIVTLMHYRPNALGDSQTSPATHGGLTRFGAQVVRGMNRLGMIIDVAHAAETTVRDVLKASAAPVICSHTALKSPAFDHPRFITAETARAVAAAGGLVGAWPAGFGATTMNDFVDRIFRIAETVGPEHAALGTDMDANYRPVLTRYAQVPLLVSELLRRGYGTPETVAFVGGNFKRVWGVVARA